MVRNKVLFGKKCSTATYIPNALRVNYTLSRRTAKPKSKPRKSLIVFIESEFLVAMKIITGFLNMGTDVKLLAAAC